MTTEGKLPEDVPSDFRGDIFNVIDEFLTDISNQKLVDSYKVQDFCLDLRLIVSNSLKESNYER